MSPREPASERLDDLLMRLAIACKYAGLLEAELSPLEMKTQATILLAAIQTQGLKITLDNT